MTIWHNLLIFTLYFFEADGISIELSEIRKTTKTNHILEFDNLLPLFIETISETALAFSCDLAAD